MADTRVQFEVEDWIRREWMPKKFGQKFTRERVKLSSGGFCDFDALSEDQKIVAMISTSGDKTTSGKHGVGKLQKIRNDMFFLLLVPNVERRVVVLTEKDMFKACSKEVEGGRVPDSIEFIQVEIPQDLNAKLTAAKLKASQETSPKP